VTQYNFDISGKINTETIEEAIDKITLILEDNNISINRIQLYSGTEEILSMKKKQ